LSATRLFPASWSITLTRSPDACNPNRLRLSLPRHAEDQGAFPPDCDNGDVRITPYQPH
jgi:hypothetical protein